jgi:superfamily I DNA and RNA helicase
MIPPCDLVGAHDLTFGEYERLLESPDRWERLGWAIDRQTFCGALREIREIRNDVMHFSPDPLEESQIDSLRVFIKWLRVLDPDHKGPA